MLGLKGYVIPLVLGNKHLLIPYPCQTSYCNELLTVYSNEMSYESTCHYSPLLQLPLQYRFYTAINTDSVF